MKKILIVEDNVMNQQLFAALLNNSGYEISQKYDGENIISDTIAYGPDLILMDIQLPGKNGDELMCMIREDSNINRIIIVAVTAYAIDGDEDRFLDMGFDGYMSKPIDASEFIITIGNLLMDK